MVCVIARSEVTKQSQQNLLLFQKLLPFARNGTKALN